MFKPFRWKLILHALQLTISLFGRQYAGLTMLSATQEEIVFVGCAPISEIVSEMYENPSRMACAE